LFRFDHTYAHCVVQRKTAVPPGKQNGAQLLGGFTFSDKEIEHACAKALLEQFHRNRRQCDECAVRPKHAVGCKHMDMRVEVYEIAKRLHE